MARLHSYYYPARLIECPERWEHYKEFTHGTLGLFESEHKYPGKLFFDFMGLRSSRIEELNTFQENIYSDVRVSITTTNNKYEFIISKDK